MSATSTLRVILTAEADGLTRGLKQGTSSARSFQMQIQSLASPIQSFSSQLVATAAGAIGVSKAMDVVTRSLKLAGDAEGAQVAFKTLIGDADKATALLTELSDFAAKTPFELPELRDASRALLAFGEDSRKVTETLRRIGDVSALINQPIGEIAELYGKARVQGRLFAQDINQLTGRGIPIIQELAKQFKVSESQVRKLVESGRVGFGNLEKAFDDLTSSGGKFFKGMEAQSETMLGKWSTFKDGITLSLTEIGTQIAKALNIKDAIDGMIKEIDRLNGIIKQNEGELKKQATVWGAIGGVIGDTVDNTVKGWGGLVNITGAIGTNIGVAMIEQLRQVGLATEEEVNRFIALRERLVAQAGVGFRGMMNMGEEGQANAAFKPFPGGDFLGPQMPGMEQVAPGAGKGMMRFEREGGFFSHAEFKPMFEAFDGLKAKADVAFAGIKGNAINAATQIKNKWEEMGDLFGKLNQRAADIIDATRTPMEKFKEQIAELKGHLDAGRIDKETFMRAGKLAEDELNQSGPKDPGPRFANAVTAGSAEAVSAMNRFLHGSRDTEPKRHTKLLENLITATHEQTQQFLDALDFGVLTR